MRDPGARRFIRLDELGPIGSERDPATENNMENSLRKNLTLTSGL